MTLSTQYDPQAIQQPITERWLEAGAFAAVPDERTARYVVMMPLPNVTGALHMGHAMDNVMQDLLTRWHRMLGDNTLWQPGTDHAGIATQAVVETRLFDLEGKTRHDIGRDGLVERIWEWKEEYQARIITQQQQMGCSCDWDRQRFTMDEVCRAAVRETFFRMFRDRLIYRGNRLVNWDCKLETAVADDEVEHKSTQGQFWHLRYPILDAQAGEPEYVVVATTRPETMLGDTAVATHPEPRKELERLLAAAKERLEAAKAKERPEIEAEIEALEERIRELLPRLEQLVAMAKDGRKVRLPLMDREIPLLLDEWAKPALGSGCVKITPAHDPNDYEVWQRHLDEIRAINILDVDGSLNDNAGAYAGLDRFDARKRVVADLEGQGLLDRVEDREIEIGLSDRSKTPIEPFLSKQWFVRMGDVEGGVVLGRGTDKERRSAGLAQAAMDAVSEEWTSPTGRQLSFHPDPRYRSTYYNWLAEKRDWCISRQLWWGHRIPIWRKAVRSDELAGLLEQLHDLDPERAWLQVDADGQRLEAADARGDAIAQASDIEVQVCLRLEATEEMAPRLEAAGLEQDPDVLDTWFSSALWPHSTLGWPDPSAGKEDAGQTSLAASDSRQSAVDYYYPGSCLVTGRDIITLWVVRMVLTGLYNLGDLPFTDVFIHANILDGRGVRMSKSKGNGVDPVDIIERYGADAMRYVLCDMQTGLQDIRLPVQAVSPFEDEGADERLIDLAKAKAGSTLGVYIDPVTGQEFDVIGQRKDLPQAKVISDRFEVGRNFCNKLWNAARFAVGNLEGASHSVRKLDELAPEDRWILSRLSRAVRAVSAALEDYNPSAAVGAAREFFWTEFCDWYLELVKPRMSDETGPIARQVVAWCLDQVLRLLHPFVPFISEALWAELGQLAPTRGVDRAMPVGELLIHAEWPQPSPDFEDEAIEARFERFQGVVRAVRDIRAEYNVQSKPLRAAIRTSPELVEELRTLEKLLCNLTRLEALEVGADVARPELAASQVVGEVEIYVSGVIDPEKERARLQKQLEKLQGGLRGAEAKLSNENFVARAPAEVVEAERERVADLRSQIEALEASLAALAAH